MPPPVKEEKTDVSDTNNSSGAPITDVSRPPAKESLPPTAPFTPVKEGKNTTDY